MKSHRNCVVFALLCLAAEMYAQPAGTVLGTVTGFKANAFELELKPDNGGPISLPFGAETQVVQVPPGERDFTKAAPAAMTAILPGDRVMVSFAPGVKEARRIVLITSRDIAKRNEAEKLDWKQRGISGIATSRSDGEIALEVRTPQGKHTAVVTVTEKTKVRRYAPDSVKFSEAIASDVAEIAAGDQVRARGLKSEDGLKVTAEEVVFGTFLTRLGPITAIRPDAGEIEIQELTTKETLTIRVVADSQLKMMPDMRAMIAPRPAGHAAPPGEEKGFDLQATMERLPAARLEDLKIGGSVIVTSTRGAKSDSVTAILLLSNADFLVKMAAGAASGENGMEAISRLHGGMLVGSGGGISLPTMLQ